MFLPGITTTSISDSQRNGEGLASEEKVIFVLELLGPVLQFIPTDSTERISEELGQKLLGSLSGPLRASVTKEACCTSYLSNL